MDWDIKKLVNDPDWQGLPYEERYKAMQEVDPDFAALPAAERAKGIQEMRGVDLKSIHAANVAAGEAAYKPGWLETYEQGAKTGGGPGGYLAVAQRMAKRIPEAIEETPQRLDRMISSVPELAKAVVLPPALGGGVPPILKTMIEKTTEPLISPETTGKALTEAAIDTALTAGTGKLVGATATKLAPAAGRRILQSWLKPSEADFKFSKDPIGAALEEKFTGNTAKSYRADVISRKNELLKEVKDTLSNSTQKTPLSDVFSILDGEEARLKNSIGVANKDTLLNRITTLREEIANKYPNDLTQVELHKLRKEIDSSIPKFTTEAVEQEANKLKYNLRTGINDILEANNPGIAKANKRVSELIDIERMVDNKIHRAANASLAPPGTIPGEILGTVLGHPGVYTGARIAGMALSSPAVLTRAAKVLNTFAPKRGLAGALERTQPARGFRGDIKPAVAPAQEPPPVPGAAPPGAASPASSPSLSQAATQAATSGSASTVRSPQPAGGLAEAIQEMRGGTETLPEIPAVSPFPPMSQDQVMQAILDSLKQRRFSAMENTPSRGGY